MHVTEYVPETPEIADLFAAYLAASTAWALADGASALQDARDAAAAEWWTARRRHAATP